MTYMRITNDDKELIITALEHYIKEEETRFNVICEGLERLGYKNIELVSGDLSKALRLYERLIEE